MPEINLRVLFLTLVILAVSTAAFGQGTAFTYQGALADNGNPANGQYDLQFTLFDTPTVGTGVLRAGPSTVSNVTLTAGVFTVQLDFGSCPACFDGTPRFLEIAVKPASGSTFTTLSPRQPVTSTPYAIKSQTSTSADGLSLACVNCVTSSQIGSVSGSTITGTIPLASLPAGSTGYIQNTTNPQTASNFNISGNGTAGGTLSANTINAQTQFNIGGNRVLRADRNTFNLFAGDFAGGVTTGTFNAFFGESAGQSNTTATFNSFFGSSAGQVNTTGADNSYFGSFAGSANTTGETNSFFGTSAGSFNTSGSNNIFIGSGSGTTNVTGGQNTVIGASANVGDPNLTNATAIGYQAFVTQNNSFVLGSINGVNGSAADTRIGIGTTAPAKHLHVMGAGDQEIMIESSDTSGTKWSLQSSAGSTNGRFEIIDRTANFSRFSIITGGNVGIGTVAPSDKLHVNGIIRVATLGAADTTTTLCRNSLNQIANCNSSSLRYKTDIAPFMGGLDLVARLRPITFTWKQGGSRDVGFGAEEVAKVEPLFTFANDQGEIEGVKYDRISVVLVNALKEQQLQIQQQQTAIDGLVKLVCADHPAEDLCKAR